MMCLRDETVFSNKKDIYIFNLFGDFVLLLSLFFQRRRRSRDRRRSRSRDRRSRSRNRRSRSRDRQHRRQTHTPEGWVRQSYTAEDNEK